MPPSSNASALELALSRGQYYGRIYNNRYQPADYDLALARQLVSGRDVWVNLPRPPLEASGTSGMKAMFNGCLHLSVLDGWWPEGFNGANGWGIEPLVA